MKLRPGEIALMSLVSLCAPAYSRTPQDAGVLEKIARVENGLVAFSPGVPDTGQAREKLSLSQRMEHYKIPGVSIAVINDNKIDWAKGYGTLAVGKTERNRRSRRIHRAPVVVGARAFALRGWLDHGACRRRAHTARGLKSPSSAMIRDTERRCGVCVVAVRKDGAHAAYLA